MDPTVVSGNTPELPRRRRTVYLVLVTAALLGCGGSEGSTGGLIINDGDGDTIATAGEFTPDAGQLVAFGMGTVQNIGSENITLIGVTPNLFGDIELRNAIVAGPDRESTMVTSADTFPPELAELGQVAPLDGYILEPTLGRAGLPTDNILLGFAVGPDSAVAGMNGYCLDYRVGDESKIRSECWKSQQFLVCDDLDAPICVVPG